MDPDLKARPFSSVEQLKHFRDFIAHGKPIEENISYEEIIEQDADEEFELRIPMWHENFCTLQNLIEVSEDVELVWQALLKSADNIPL